MPLNNSLITKLRASSLTVNEQLGRVGSQNYPSYVGRVGSGPVLNNLINMQFFRNRLFVDYSCNIAIYYRLLIYSNLAVGSNV